MAKEKTWDEIKKEKEFEIAAGAVIEELKTRLSQAEAKIECLQNELGYLMRRVGREYCD